MPTIHQLGLSEPEDFTWPCSYRYNLATAFGYTQLELSVELGLLNGLVEKSVTYGQRLWNEAIAPAINFLTVPLWMDYVIWRSSPATGIAGGLMNSGQVGGRTSGRNDCAVLILHTGENDRYSTRRLFLAGTPRDCVSSRMLTNTGWDHVTRWAHALAMSIVSYGPIAETGLLLMFPNVVDPTPENLLGVGFRRVNYIRVCQYTDKAPEQSTSVAWP